MLFMRNVLIVCDFSDLIRFRQVDERMIRHIYTLLFLFEHHVVEDAREITLVDRSGLSYHKLWKVDSSMANYIDRFLICKSWNDVSFITYDMIVCHYELEVDLNLHLKYHYEEHYSHIQVFSMLNPVDANFEYFFPRVDSLFVAGGLCELSESFKQNQLFSFKKKLHRGFVEYTSAHYEELFGVMLTKILAVNERRKGAAYGRVLILDDYKRRLYIGDSTIWLSMIRRLLRYCGDFEEVVINCDNSRLLPRLSELYETAFQGNVSFQGLSWDQINFDSYDLIILETDIVLKFFLHIHPLLHTTSLNNTSVYTISPLIDRPSVHKYDWDFFENHLENEGEKFGDLIRSSDKEIFISEEERSYAELWLKEKGVTKDDDLIVILNGSSRDQKVILQEEFVELVKLMLQHKNSKVLVFNTDYVNEETFQLTANQKERFIYASSQGIRRDLNILASRFTKAVIGPCTGMLHLANGAFVYLLNRHLIAINKLPFMMVYTGRQHHDVDYLPHNWWSNSLVNCAVIIKVNGEEALVALDEVVANTPHFRTVAGEVSSIKASMLYEFLSSAFLIQRRCLIFSYRYLIKNENCFNYLNR